MLTISDASSLILQVSLSIVFISLVFFFYVSKVENAIVVNQIGRVIGDFTTTINEVATPEIRQTLHQAVQTLKPEDMRSADKQVEDSNRKLVNKSVVIVGTITAVSIAVVVFIFWRFHVNKTAVIAESLVGVGAVVLVEVLFATYFVKKYRTLDPNVVKQSLVRAFKSYRDG